MLLVKSPRVRTVPLNYLNEIPKGKFQDLIVPLAAPHLQTAKVAIEQGISKIPKYQKEGGAKKDK